MQRIGMTARMNALTGAVEYDFPYCDLYPADDSTHAAIDALIHMCAVAGMKHDMIVDAALSYALRNQYSPVTEWIESVPWDGVDRLPALCETVTMEDPRRRLVVGAFGIGLAQQKLS
jgi:predicted P-loop ATPase